MDYNAARSPIKRKAKWNLKLMHDDASPANALVDSADAKSARMDNHKGEVVRGISEHVRANLDLLKRVEDSWQPTDFLPDLTKEDWRESLGKLREQAAALPDELLVILVGTMVTEEALPSYQTSFNRLAGVEDSTGAS